MHSRHEVLWSLSALRCLLRKLVLALARLLARARGSLTCQFISCAGTLMSQVLQWMQLGIGQLTLPQKLCEEGRKTVKGRTIRTSGH